MRNALWEAMARIRHWFGRHTMIPVEIWRDGRQVGTNGELCWLCPLRTP